MVSQMKAQPLVLETTANNLNDAIADIHRQSQRLHKRAISRFFGPLRSKPDWAGVQAQQREIDAVQEAALRAVVARFQPSDGGVEAVIASAAASSGEDVNEEAAATPGNEADVNEESAATPGDEAFFRDSQEAAVPGDHAANTSETAGPGNADDPLKALLIPPTPIPGGLVEARLRRRAAARAKRRPGKITPEMQTVKESATALAKKLIADFRPPQEKLQQVRLGTTDFRSEFDVQAEHNAILTKTRDVQDRYRGEIADWEYKLLDPSGQRGHSEIHHEHDGTQLAKESAFTTFVKMARAQLDRINERLLSDLEAGLLRSRREHLQNLQAGKPTGISPLANALELLSAFENSSR